MKKILAALAFTGLIAALPVAANAHDRGHTLHGYAGAQHRDCDHPRHFHRHAHHHRFHHDHPRPIAYYGAPRIEPVYVPAIPLPPLPRPHVNIVWRVY